MRRSIYAIGGFLFLVASMLWFGQIAQAEIYGYELRIIASNGLQNGDKIPVEDVELGQLSFKLEVIDPAKPNVLVRADEWQVAVYSLDGNHLADFVVRGKEATDYAYQATINALGDIAEQYNGKAIILKGKAKVGERYTNEVSFRMVLGAESVRVAPAKQGFPWLQALIWFALFLLMIFLIVLLLRKTRYELKIVLGDDLRDDNRVFIQDVLNGRLSFKLEVTNPDKPSKIVKVDEWRVAVYTPEGVHLTDFIVDGNEIEENTYQVTIGLSPKVSSQYADKSMVIRCCAKVKRENSNEIKLKIDLV